MSDKQNVKNDNIRQKNNNSPENKDQDRVSECGSKVFFNGNEVSWMEVNLKEPSASPDETVIEMKNVQENGVFNTRFTLIKIFFRQCFRTSRYESQNLYKKQKDRNPWVQFSMGKGYGRGFMGFGDSEGGGDFDYDPETRNTFVLIVMLLTLACLLVTAGWLLMVYQIPVLHDMFRNPPLVMLIIVPTATMILWYVIMCVPYATKTPCVWVCLVLMVILMSLTAGMVTVRYKTLIILYAFLGTAAIVLVCTILACTTFDFTSFWLYFVVITVVFAVICMIVFISMSATGVYLKPLHIALLVISTLLAAVGLIMELQMILGGKSIEMDESDYALAALMLYSSIIKIFLNLVQIIGLASED